VSADVVVLAVAIRINCPTVARECPEVKGFYSFKQFLFEVSLEVLSTVSLGNLW
jgi:hypothetical protein